MYPFFYNPNNFNTYDSNENFLCPYFQNSYNNHQNNFRGEHSNFDDLEERKKT